MRHLNYGTDHRHSKSCCDQSSPARRTMMLRVHSIRWCSINILELRIHWNGKIDGVTALVFKRDCWRQASLPPMNTRAVIRTIFAFLCQCLIIACNELRGFNYIPRCQKSNPSNGHHGDVTRCQWPLLEIGIIHGLVFPRLRRLCTKRGKLKLGARFAGYTVLV